MSIKQIIEKEQVTTDEAIKVVKYYIKVRNDVDIGSILVPSYIDTILLTQAFQYACGWLKENHTFNDDNPI